MELGNDDDEGIDITRVPWMIQRDRNKKKKKKREVCIDDLLAGHEREKMKGSREKRRSRALIWFLFL